MSPKFGYLRKLLKLSLPILHRETSVQNTFTASTAYFSSCHSDHSTKTVKTKPDWNRAVLEAEKVVGYPNIFISFQALPSDDVLSIVGELRKLVGTSHPLLKITKCSICPPLVMRETFDLYSNFCHTNPNISVDITQAPSLLKFGVLCTTPELFCRRLIYNGRNNMQTRGLIVLLASKTAGRPLHATHLPSAEEDCDSSILQSQRTLAQITEMIHTACLIHKGVVNLKGLMTKGKSILKDMEFGNKIAILVGDYLLTNASVQLEQLKNTTVVEIMSLAIKHFMEGEFVFEQDIHGTAYPLESTTIRDWEVRTYLTSGSLLSNGCQSAMVLADHRETVQMQAFDLGKQLGLTWQAFLDLQPFIDKTHPPGTAFDLASSPLILHLKNDPSILDLILPHRENLEGVDYEKIQSVISNGTAINEAKQLCKKYAEETIEILHHFPYSEAREALKNIIAAMDCSYCE